MPARTVGTHLREEVASLELAHVLVALNAGGSSCN